MFRGSIGSRGPLVLALLLTPALASAQAAPPAPPPAGELPPPPPPPPAGEAPPADPAAQPQPAPAPTPPPPPPPAPAPAPPPNAPTIYVEQPPPPPPVPRRGGHRHDGFYLRMSIGAGYLSADREYDTSAIPNSSLSGGGLALDLLIGGSPSPGFVVGGALLLNGAENPELEVGGTTSEADVGTGASVIGVFVDGFPDPEGGLHLGGTLGLATYAVNHDDDDLDEETGGFGAAVWIGYGGWVGSEWSLGGMLRLTAAATRRDFEAPDGSDVVQEVGVGSASILFTALYH